MKKIVFLTIISLLIFTGCGTKNNIKFKNEYESLNGKTNTAGKEHRKLEISKSNPYVYATAKDIVKKIEKKETFYVYFGSKLCPWCRSVIEKSIEAENKFGIKKVYYVDIWDDEGNEILRDKYELDGDKVILTVAGTKEYQQLIGYFKDYLRDYNLTDKDGKEISTGEKRIYAPNFIYVEKGKIKKLATGKADGMTDPREKLTSEMLKSQEKVFNEFFSNK